MGSFINEHRTWGCFFISLGVILIAILDITVATRAGVFCITPFILLFAGIVGMKTGGC